MTSKKRYTAVLKMVEIEETEPSRNDRGNVPAVRETDREVVNLVVRAKDMDSLKTKLKAHIDLAEEL